MANILLLTYYFPPHNAIGCRRVYAWAKYLKRMGHDVIVLTADNPGDDALRSYNVDLSFLPIYRLTYFNVLNLLMKVFKPRTLLSAEPDKVQQKGFGIVLFEKVLDFFYKHISNRGILFGCSRFPTFFEGWFFPAYLQAVKIIRHHRIDAVITSSPPPSINPVGLYLKRKFKNVLWIAEYRDLWVRNPVHHGLFPFTVLENAFEKRCIRHSDALVVVSEAMARILRQQYPGKAPHVFCIENGYDNDLAKQVRAGIRSTGGVRKRMVYSGTLYPSRSNPEMLFQIADRRCVYFRDKLDIVFYGNHQTKRILDRLFLKYPRAHGIIRYGGFLSSETVFQAQNTADVLFFMEKDASEDGVLTGKIFEYMMYAKPILCYGITRHSGIGRFLDKTGLCTFCGTDPAALEAGLEGVVKRTLKVHPNLDYIAGFSRQRQAEKLDRILRSYLRMSRR